MKFTKLYLLLAAISASSFSISQEPLYNWGEPSTNDYKNHSIENLLSLGDDGFVLLRKYSTSTYNHTYFIELYDKTLSIKNEQKVEFNGGVMGDMYDIEHIEVVNGKIYVFVTHWHKDNGKNTLFVKELSLNGQLEDIATLLTMDAQKLGNRGRFEPKFSSDGSKLLILSQFPSVKKANERIGFACFSVADMSKIWETEQEIDPEQSRANNEIAVDNMGQAYLFKKYWVRPVWKYVLYTYDGKSSWKSHTDLNLESKQIMEYKLAFDNNNELAMFALLSDELSAFEKHISATWTLSIQSDLNIGSATIKPINEEIIKQYKGEKAVDNVNRAFINDFSIKDILFRTDGHMLVLLEQLRTDKKGIPGTSPVQYNYEWNYGDMLTLCLDYQKNEMQWWQKGIMAICLLYVLIIKKMKCNGGKTLKNHKRLSVLPVWTIMGQSFTI